MNFIGEIEVIFSRSLPLTNELVHCSDWSLISDWAIAWGLSLNSRHLGICKWCTVQVFCIKQAATWFVLDTQWQYVCQNLLSRPLKNPPMTTMLWSEWMSEMRVGRSVSSIQSCKLLLFSSSSLISTAVTKLWIIPVFSTRTVYVWSIRCCNHYSFTKYNLEYNYALTVPLTCSCSYIL